MINKLKNYWLNLSLLQKLILVASSHLIINFITTIVYFLDDYSYDYQILHSCIHVIFFGILLKKIYLPTEKFRLSIKQESVWIIGFIILNIVPVFQGYRSVDNGFVPVWALAPQIKLGIPYTYLRWFPECSSNFQTLENSHSIHLNLIFLNLYICLLISLLILWLKTRLIHKLQ